MKYIGHCIDWEGIGDTLYEADGEYVVKVWVDFVDNRDIYYLFKPTLDNIMAYLEKRISSTELKESAGIGWFDGKEIDFKDFPTGCLPKQPVYFDEEEASSEILDLLGKKN